MIAAKQNREKEEEHLWHSAIYEGTVRHRRYTPKLHDFTYKVFMVYVDLHEIDDVCKQTPWWSNKQFSLAWFRRKDFFDGVSTSSLYEAVANKVEQETGTRPVGPIRMLTNLRYFGFIINPITCYYCFDKTGEVLQTVVAEVTNTPWGQRCHYILDMTKESSTKPVVTFAKAMHVSPFQPMNLIYQWRGKKPAEQLSIHLDVFSAEDVNVDMTLKNAVSPVFDATLLLQRQAMTAKNMNRKIFFYPLMTVKVLLAIYWQAVKLWCKKIPFHSAPMDAVVKNDNK